MNQKPTLGEERGKAPCLPRSLLTSFAALPVYEGHGHPGLLYARDDLPDDLAETWIESYRLCYSFSAKATLFNLIADDFKRGSGQRLAGWVFVGRAPYGTGREYAKGVADCMYNQFRLALCKAIAGFEKSLNGLNRWNTACSNMTGIVVVQVYGAVQSTSVLCYEVHEFPFPLTLQKLRQELRSKFKSSDVEDVTTIPVSVAHSSSVMEVVDLISDDDSGDDDKPLINPAGTQAGPCPHPISDNEEDRPLLTGEQQDSQIHEAVSACSIDEKGTTTCVDHAKEGEDVGIQPNCAELEIKQEEEWRKRPAFKRWDQERNLCRSDPNRAKALFQSLDKQRQEVYESVERAHIRGSGEAEAHASSEHAGLKAAGAHNPRGAEQEKAQPVADDKRVSKNARSQNKPAVSFAKLRVVPNFGPSPSQHRIEVECESTFTSAAPPEAANHIHAATTHADSNGAPTSSRSPAAATRELARHLQEYDEACNSHRVLWKRVQDRMRARSPSVSHTDVQDASHAIQHSVLVSIMGMALRHAGAEAHSAVEKPACVHGFLVGSVRGGQMLIKRADAARCQPTCCSEKDKDSTQDDAWLRHEARRCLGPEADLLHHAASVDSNDGSAIFQEVSNEKDETSREQLEVEEGGNHGEKREELKLVAGSGEKRMLGDDGSEVFGGKVEAVSFHIKTETEAVCQLTKGAVVEVTSNGEARMQEGEGSSKQATTPGANEEVSKVDRPPDMHIKDPATRGGNAQPESGTDEQILGYFRVAVGGDCNTVVEQDRRRLCVLNSKGLGLVCVVQEGREIDSESEYLRFVLFTASAEHASPIVVVQEPFVPRHMLQELAASEGEAVACGVAPGRLPAGDVKGYVPESVAALVKVHVVNLRVQEAYMKRQLAFASPPSKNDKQSCTVLPVVANPSRQDTAQTRASKDAGTMVLPGARVCRYVALPMPGSERSSSSCPDWKEERSQSCGKLFYWNMRTQETTWEKPPGWDSAEQEGTTSMSTDVGEHPAAKSAGRTRKKRKSSPCQQHLASSTWQAQHVLAQGFF